jgi:hypothetical protein
MMMMMMMMMIMIFHLHYSIFINGVMSFIASPLPVFELTPTGPDSASRIYKFEKAN